MRIGIIGLGRIGSFHADTLTALDAVDALVLTDALPGVAEKVAARHASSTVVDSPAEVLAAGVDAVVIASSTPTHAELLLAAVQAGVPAFCEKPVAQDPREGSRVLKELAGTDVPVQIGFPRRFDQAFVAVREEVEAGRLGWLHTVRSTTLDPAPPPAGYIAGSGGIFHDCAIHDFDAVRWITGQEVVSVFATGSNQGADFIKDADDVDTAAAVLTMEDGTLAVISNSRHNGRGYDVRMEAHGSTDAIAAGLDDSLPLRSGEPGVSWPAGPPATFFMDRLDTAFRTELTTFVEVAQGRRPSPCTIEDGVAASWIAEACTISWRERRAVRLDEVRG